MATPAAIAARAGRAEFRTGKKPIFLPHQVVSMLRPKADTPPQFATFKVPLSWNKLDLRDYLLHAYNVRTLGVRSHVKQQRIEQQGGKKRLYRPLAIKMMIAELEKPFVWPEKVQDENPWNPDILRKRQELALNRSREQDHLQYTGRMPLRDARKDKGDPDAADLREQAEYFLKNGGWENARPLDIRFKGKEEK